MGSPGPSQIRSATMTRRGKSSRTEGCVVLFIKIKKEGEAAWGIAICWQRAD